MKSLYQRARSVVSVSILAWLLAMGCGDNSRQLQSPIPVGATKPYTKQELDELIATGISMAAVTNTFGQPASQLRSSEGVMTLTYAFPIETIMEEGGLRMTGFDVHFKDGTVVTWSPIMGESRRGFQAGGPQTSFGEQSFRLFVATGGLTNVASAVDLEGSADVSDLIAAPDLMFNAKVFAGSSGSDRPGEHTLIIVVSEEDASKLKGLSEAHLGKRLLIVSQNKVIAAPVISAPLDSRQLRLTVSSSGVLESLWSQ